MIAPILKWSHLALFTSLAALSTSPVLAAPVQQAYVKASNTGVNIFGSSVAVWGDTMVVGAPSEAGSATGVNGDQSDKKAPGSGAVFVFVRTGTNWLQEAYLKASNTDAHDEFGISVALVGNTIVVGATGEDSGATGINGNQGDNSARGAGSAYIFIRDGTNWSQQAYIKASNTGERLFGTAVALSEDTVVVGSYSEAAYVFTRSGTNWSQEARLQASNIEGEDFFGPSVAISGDTVVVGAFWESSYATGVNGDQNNNGAVESGAAYVFVRNGTNWNQQAYLKASNTGLGDEFGRSVTVSGDTAVIGAPWEASNATGINGDQHNDGAGQSGAAYVFVRTGTNWTQQAYVKASNVGGGDGFGWSVRMSGNTLAIGSWGENSDAVGVNGTQDNENALQSGAAYVFVRSGTNWEQQAYLKASNTDAFDQLGAAVAVSGDTVVAGAWREASNATGIDGNQNDNSLPYAGAVYVFAGLGFRPRLALVPDGSGGYFIRFNGTPAVTYRLQRATNPDGPWNTGAPLTAPASGFVEFHDVSPLPGQAFYRTVRP